MKQVFFATSETIFDTGYYGIVKITDKVVILSDQRHFSKEDAERVAHQLNLEYNKDYNDSIL